MKNSRRSRIIALLSMGKSEEEILQILNAELPQNKFGTTHKQAIYGTQRDLGIPPKEQRHTKTHIPSRSNNREVIADYQYLIKQLQSFNADPIIKRYQIRDLYGKTPRDIISFSMGSNIYRAFHHETPSRRYAKWRWNHNAELLYEMLIKIRDQSTFNSFLFETATSLVEDWGFRNEFGNPSKMNIGIALKVTNLIFKHFFFSQTSNNPDLRRFLHVPWDSHTLEPIKNIWEGTPIIPLSPSQGFVKGFDTYSQLHDLITNITVEAKVDRIIYEFWAWDNSH